MPPPVLAVEGLVLARQGVILSHPLSFSLSAGEALHLVGANGSGKTTLLNTLATLSVPISGHIYWQGQPQSSFGDELRALWHYCGHIDALKHELTLLENVQWQTRLMGYALSTEALQLALEQMALSSVLHVPVGLFSKGQQRRAALLKLRLFSRPLWLLDEPFSALDTDGAAILVNWIDQHLSAGGTVIFTTHQSYPPLARTPAQLLLEKRHI